VQKQLNLSICRFDCGLQWAEGCTSAIVFARWRQCALVEGHVAVTCQIILNHPSTASMRLMANYFDHLLSLDTPTYTVAQIGKCFEPSTVLWAFHTIHPSIFFLYVWATPHNFFGPYLLRPNGCMDQDATWYEARLRPRRLCLRWRPRSPAPKGAEPPNFRSMFIAAKRLDG